MDENKSVFKLGSKVPTTTMYIKFHIAIREHIPDREKTPGGSMDVENREGMRYRIPWII